ncbi:hypothetical protein HD553DRAFT_344187 [Filobasidium floriforme]|uniref:uncharacterized protein n=1 Tax=Filobasidium floriforme TaxID=5210 RepID=UPI001E8CBC5C|nr:uncharacterized protein HD553DRAFT_344187 [Filobasidium floriforme]KAH8081473.1 hypothetical protein HD553DRAFT_344187 [Filobasidium floriforme]
MNVITDVVQLVLHYSKHIGGVLDILHTELPSEVPVKLPDAGVWYAYRGCHNSTSEWAKYITDRIYNPHDAKYSLAQKGSLERLPATEAYLYTAIHRKVLLAIQTSTGWSQHILEAGNSVLIPPNRSAILFHLTAATLLLRKPMHQSVFCAAAGAHWTSRDWGGIARVEECDASLNARYLSFWISLGRQRTDLNFVKLFRPLVGLRSAVPQLPHLDNAWKQCNDWKEQIFEALERRDLQLQLESLENERGRAESRA